MQQDDEENKQLLSDDQIEFANRKLISLNNFFMRKVILGLILSLTIFVISFVFLIVLLDRENIDETLRITIISMLATFILTTSKTLIDRIIELVIYIMRLLGEEQRGFNKKIGIETEDVDFQELEEDKENE